MLAIALGLALTGLPAQAHHMKGLPHFGYKDMGWYPQIPSKETIRRVKDLLIIATTMPGDPKAGAQVNIHLYVKELTANQPLSVPIHYSITRKTLFFFTESVRPRSELRPILELYQIATTFPKGGNYTLTLHLPNQALTTIPIKVTP
jgi:hypothetical protein